MDTTAAYVIFFFGIFFAVLIYMKYWEIQNKKRFLSRMEKQWGEIPQRDYTHAQMESISRYFRNKGEEGFCLDDITWHDLDMDSVFKLINTANSSIGEEYLYDLLRRPLLDKASLEERKRVVDYVESHKKERLELQYMYGQMGRTGKISFSDYIHNLDMVAGRANMPHYLMAGLGAASILAAVLLPRAGVFLLIAAFCININSYFKEKGEVEPFFISISYIARMLKAADIFVKTVPSELEDYKIPANEARSRFKKFRKNAKWISAGKGNGSVLDSVLDYIRMFFHVDLIKFNVMVQDVRENMDYIDRLVEAFGSLEACIAIASFKKTRAFYAVPELLEGKEVCFEAEELYHPLITEPVANSICEHNSILVTGSNASGKSTFLKTMAINAVLSQTIYIAMAKRCRASFFRIYSSMALNDSLENKESYYIVEIKSLKRILDAGRDTTPMLCFIDEVLRGTNTIERIAASSQILKSLAKPHVLCCAATHDIELTHILEQIYSNYHFEEDIQDNDILFNYKLMHGRAVTRNAIKLLGIIGYDKSIITNADEAAAEFIKTNNWRTETCM